jgi:hypothetical protein
MADMAVTAAIWVKEIDDVQVTHSSHQTHSWSCWLWKKIRLRKWRATEYPGYPSITQTSVQPEQDADNLKLVRLDYP